MSASRPDETLVAVAMTFLEDVGGGNGKNLDTPAAQAACMGDAIRLCRKEIRESKSIDEAKARVRPCMEQNLEQLSPACRKVFEE